MDAAECPFAHWQAQATLQNTTNSGNMKNMKTKQNTSAEPV
jgi:hypothetical protein